MYTYTYVCIYTVYYIRIYIYIYVLDTQASCAKWWGPSRRARRRKLRAESCGILLPSTLCSFLGLYTYFLVFYS